MKVLWLWMAWLVVLSLGCGEVRVEPFLQKADAGSDAASDDGAVTGDDGGIDDDDGGVDDDDGGIDDDDGGIDDDDGGIDDDDGGN